MLAWELLPGIWANIWAYMIWQVIDRMPWWKVGNKYIDSLDDHDEDMNEAISAFR